MPSVKAQPENIRTIVISRSGKTVTKAKAVFAIDERTSFVVDDFIDAKERRRAGKPATVYEVDGLSLLEHKGVDLI